MTSGFGSRSQPSCQPLKTHLSLLRLEKWRRLAVFHGQEGSRVDLDAAEHGRLERQPVREEGAEEHGQDAAADEAFPGFLRTQLKDTIQLRSEFFKCLTIRC